MDHDILKIELDTDPKELGLAEATDTEAAELLKEIGASDETITRELVSTADIMTVVFSNKTEFFLLSQLNLVRLNLLSPIGNISPVAIQDVLKDIFTEPEYTNTRAALIALATRDASREEKIPGLLDPGESVSKVDIHIARRR